MQRRALASAFCRSLPPGGPVSSALTSLAAELPLCTHPDQSPAYPLWRLDNRRDFHALSQAHLLAPRSPQLPSPLPSLRYAATSSAQASTPATVADLTIAMQEALDSKRFESALAMFRASDGHLLLPATHRNPTAVASVYDCALKACAAGGAADDALKLMATMWRRKVPVGRIAQGSVLKALCTAGRREEALRHLKSISKTRLTTVMFNTVLGACAASHDAAVGLRCWELMRKREVPPDAVTFCEVMRLHGAAGQASEIQSVWDTAVNTLGIETSISTEANVGDDGHRSMLTAAQAGALATAGDFSAATAACEALMESMSHCLPVPLHFDVAGLPSAGDEGAGGPEGGSEDGGRGRRGASPVQNLRAACNAVLHAAEARQEWAAMRRMVHLMTARGLPPDVVTYNVLLKAALRRGDGQVALHVSSSTL